MRYYLYSAGLIVFAVIVASLVPFLLTFTDNLLISLQIPSNNSQVAGIQKYNIPPISKGLPVPKSSARAVLIKDLITNATLYIWNSTTQIGTNTSNVGVVNAVVNLSFTLPRVDLYTWNYLSSDNRCLFL